MRSYKKGEYLRMQAANRLGGHDGTKLGLVAKNGAGFKKWVRLKRKAVAHREDVEEVV